MSIISQIQKNNHFQEIYYYSDSPTEWLFEDKLYYQWLLNFLNYFKPGIRLHMIHPHVNNPDDIFQYIDAMLPFYIYTDTRSYYHTQTRRNVFHHFILSVPGIGTALSLDFGNSSEPPVIFFSDSAACSNFHHDFIQMIDSCQTMLKSFKAEQIAEGNACNAKYMSLPGTVYYLSNVLPNIPQEILEKKIDAYVSDPQTKSTLKSSAAMRRSQTLEHMSNNDHYIMINLATPDDVSNGHISYLNSFSYFGQIVYYSLQEYRDHIAYIIELLRKYPHMHLAILDKPIPPIGLMANTGGGVMLYRTHLPELMLASEQLYIVDNVCCYLENSYMTLPMRSKNRANVIQLLENRLHEFDNLLQQPKTY